jgi:hypothetical protein
LVVLHPAANGIPLSVDAALEIDHARIIGGSPSALVCAFPVRANRAGLHAAALYGAFAVIAAVVFGTLSYHPF